MNKDEIEKAKEDLIFFNEGDYITREMDRSADVLEEYIKQLEQENINLKMVLDNGLNKNEKYCFYEDGKTGKCLGYSNVDDDEPCEFCKSCEALNVQGDDLYVK